MYICVCVYLLPTGVYEVNAVLQAAGHVDSVLFRLYLDCNPSLRHIQLERRVADFGCRRVVGIGPVSFPQVEILHWKKARRNSLSQRGLNLGERLQRDLLEFQEEAEEEEEACTLA